MVGFPKSGHIYLDYQSLTEQSSYTYFWTFLLVASVNDLIYIVWNFPCSFHPGNDPPSFVGNDYYCELGSVVTGVEEGSQFRRG